MGSEEGLLLLDRDGTFLWANEAASELLGYSPGELRGGSLGPSGPIAAALEDLAGGGIADANGDVRLPTKSGGRAPVSWRLWALPPQVRSGQFLLSICEAAPDLPEAPAAYRDIFEYAVEGIFRSTIDGRFTEVNPALAQLLGYSRPAEFMMAVEELYDHLYVQPERRTEFVRLMLEQGFVAGFEVELFDARGKVIWVAMFARTVRGVNGEALYFEGSVIDITDRKHTEGELRRSEERFRRLAETTRMVPFEFDPAAQVFTYVGPQAEALFGPAFRHGLTLARWAEVVHAADLDQGTRFARESAHLQSGHFQTEFRLCVAKGREVWVKQIVHHEANTSSSDRVRGFLFEITESKLVEEERERSRQQLRELSARTQLVREEERMSVAREIHDELGQALTLLKMDLSWLNGRLAQIGNDAATKPLQEKIGTMEQLIHWTLQSVRRILSSLRPPLLDELGLKDAIEFHLQSFSKRATIRYEWDAQPVESLPVTTATAVFRIFQEILTNVARHANASRLKVSLRKEGGQVLLRVQDNGCGITQEALGNSHSFGLLGMQERAWAIGGELEIHGSPRSGTTVLLKVPIPVPEGIANGAASAPHRESRPEAAPASLS
jgi:PAS domain S-box-containing protein